MVYEQYCVCYPISVYEVHKINWSTFVKRKQRRIPEGIKPSLDPFILLGVCYDISYKEVQKNITIKRQLCY